MKSPQRRAFDTDRFGIEATGVARVSEFDRSSFRMDPNGPVHKKLVVFSSKINCVGASCCFEDCVCNQQMRHVHAKVWPGGKRPPGPVVKAGTMY